MVSVRPVGIIHNLYKNASPLHFLILRLLRVVLKYYFFVRQFQGPSTCRCGGTDRFWVVSCPAENDPSTYITIAVCCEFTQPVRHVYSLGEAIMLLPAPT